MKLCIHCHKCHILWDQIQNHFYVYCICIFLGDWYQNALYFGIKRWKVSWWVCEILTLSIHPHIPPPGLKQGFSTSGGLWHSEEKSEKALMTNPNFSQIAARMSWAWGRGIENSNWLRRNFSRDWKSQFDFPTSLVTLNLWRELFQS